MQTGTFDVPRGISLRLARRSDSEFLARLHHSRRHDLQQIDGDREFVELLIKDQQRYQIAGYGAAFPNAMEFIVEKLGDPIGRVMVDFGANEVRVLDIGLIRAALGRGLGSGVLRALQAAAAGVPAPLALCVFSLHVQAKQLYLSLGFAVEQSRSGVDFMVWYPPAPQLRRHFG
jgi:GNAT superfamily N-acetyltransferase